MAFDKLRPRFPYFLERIRIFHKGKKYMSKIKAFENFSDEYDEWFIRNNDIYQLELDAIKSLIPSKGYGLEVGVGSGKFAIPLGIKIGIEPSKRMAEKAKQQGIEVYDAVAEKLPFDEGVFDFILLVTTICFVDDPLKALREAHRVLRHDGFILIAFVDLESRLGQQYQERKDRSRFYKDATFYTTKEVLTYLDKAGFIKFEIKQTLFDNQTKSSVLDGYGKGSFVVIKAMRGE
jgi:SAM-dependent methyltransferase